MTKKRKQWVMINMIVRDCIKAIIHHYARRTVPFNWGGQQTDSLHLWKPDYSWFPLAMHIQFLADLIHLCKFIWPLPDLWVPINKCVYFTILIWVTQTLLRMEDNLNFSRVIALWSGHSLVQQIVHKVVCYSQWMLFAEGFTSMKTGENHSMMPSLVGLQWIDWYSVS